MLKKISTTLFLTFVSFFLHNSAFAISSDWIKTDEVNYRVIVGNSATNEYGDTTLNLGVEYQLAKKWHTYWRTAGDAGVPLRIETDGSTNVGGLEIKWPYPHRTISYGTLQTYTYDNNITIPFSIIVEDDSQPVELSLKLKHMVCDEICIPLEDDITLSIPAGHEDVKNQKALNAALKNIPRKNGYKGLSISEAGESENTLTILVENEKGFTSPELFIEQATKNFRFPVQSSINFSADKKQALFTIPYEKLIDDQTLAAREITATLVDGKNSIEHSLVVKEGTVVLADKKKVATP